MFKEMFQTFREHSQSSGVVDDFSEVCPEGLVSSSQWLGGQGFCVMQFRHSRRELRVPPLANLLVVINLSGDANVTARMNGQPFSRPLQEGESVIVPAGTASEWHCADGKTSDMLHIYLRSGLLSKAAADSDIDLTEVDIEPEFGAHDPHIHYIGLSLLHELECAGWPGRAYADLLATALATHLLRKHSAGDSRTPNYCGGIPKYKLRRALDYISDRLGGELKVAEIAEEVNLSPYHFTRLFKRATGLAPHQYIMRERIEMAKRLLVETELPIASIALEIGFQSQSRFTTLFRQFTGTTPRVYRGQNTPFATSHHSVQGVRWFYEAERYLTAA